MAAEHARIRVRLAERLRAEARSAWAAVDPARISETWNAQLARLVLLLTAGQRAAAASADQYVAEVLARQGINPATEGRINPSALAGIASDGRNLDSLLAQPGIVAKVALSSGATLDAAMATGSALAQLIGYTQVADAGRVADGVALAARPHASGYVRMVQAGACSRCIILAGRWYRWNAGFNRHPHCGCVGIPAAENSVDLRTDPGKAFEALSGAEQDKTFGKAGAQAIRDGADTAKVVNARRGMQTAADGRLYTTEAAGRRPRLMPEQIYREAKGSRDEAIRLLRLHGFIL